jgi:hypothetical protein
MELGGFQNVSREGAKAAKSLRTATVPVPSPGGEGQGEGERSTDSKIWRDELRESHSHPPHPGSNESCLILLILSNHPTSKRDFNAETQESAKPRESKHPSALNLRSAAFTPLHHRLLTSVSRSAISPRPRRAVCFPD